MPGAGKTILASFLVQEIERCAIPWAALGLAYIFLNYKDEQKRPETILRSVLRQILASMNDSEFPPRLTELYNNYYERSPSGDNYLSLDLTMSLLRDACGSKDRTFIIVDGLDEYDEGFGVRDVLGAELLKLAQLPRCHVLVTSRWMPSIERLFTENSYRIEIRAADSDIASYVKNRVFVSPRLQRYIASDPTLEDLILSKVVEKCQGMCVSKFHSNQYPALTFC
jgi:hypothetical protein